jgi:hypothetical protein
MAIQISLQGHKSILLASALLNITPSTDTDRQEMKSVPLPSKQISLNFMKESKFVNNLIN